MGQSPNSRLNSMLQDSPTNYKNSPKLASQFSLTTTCKILILIEVKRFQLEAYEVERLETKTTFRLLKIINMVEEIAISILRLDMGRDR